VFFCNKSRKKISKPKKTATKVNKNNSAYLFRLLDSCILKFRFSIAPKISPPIAQSGIPMRNITGDNLLLTASTIIIIMYDTTPKHNPILHQRMVFSAVMNGF
jgi:hypothetical protein